MKNYYFNLEKSSVVVVVQANFSGSASSHEYIERLIP